MKKPSGTRQERPCAGSACTARTGSITPACGCFCLWDRARRGASCSLSPGAGTTCPSRYILLGTVAGRKSLAAPLARAAAGLHVAEPACLACAFLNPAGPQRRHVIEGIRRQSSSCLRACAPWASASRRHRDVQPLHRDNVLACLPCARDSCIRRTAAAARTGSRNTRRPWVLTSPRIRTRRSFWR